MHGSICIGEHGCPCRIYTSGSFEARLCYCVSNTKLDKGTSILDLHVYNSGLRSSHYWVGDWRWRQYDNTCISPGQIRPRPDWPHSGTFRPSGLMRKNRILRHTDLNRCELFASAWALTGPQAGFGKNHFYDKQVAEHGSILTIIQRADSESDTSMDRDTRTRREA